MFLHRAAIIKQLRQCNEQSHVFTDVPSSPVPEVSTFSQIQEAVSLPAHQTGKERLTLRLLVELFFSLGRKMLKYSITESNPAVCFLVSSSTAGSFKL